MVAQEETLLVYKDENGDVEDYTEETLYGETVKEVEAAVFLSEGQCFDAIVERIEIGPLGKFFEQKPRYVDDEEWEKRKKRLAYRFKLVVPGYEIEGYDVVTVSAAPNSRMNELAKCYPRGISRNAKVYVCVKNGRLKISCPPVKSPVQTP